MKLSVAMIVKNEEACIAKCLESVRDADEIVILDTGSTDGTEAAVLALGMDNVRFIAGEYEWQDHFADARNQAMARCSGDWVLTIDADETLDGGGICKIRSALSVVPPSVDVAAVNIQAHAGSSKFQNARLIRNGSDARWVGRAHEYIEASNKDRAVVPVTIFYSRSPAHDLDPDRSMRILLRQFAEQPEDTRTMYYLAREYYYRKDYENAIQLFRQYVSCGRFLAEVADGYVYLARMCWLLRRGDEAREYCMKALVINANFKEALLLMAEMSWPHNATAWRKYAEHATNEGCLFVRT
jgi:glycosyltransferase involved in cell wall biosynthesis